MAAHARPPRDERILKLREQALAAFRAGLEAAEPRAAVRDAMVRLRGLPGAEPSIASGGISGALRGGVHRFRCVAFGKAAVAMAEAAEEALPADLFPGPGAGSADAMGIAVTTHESVRAVPRFRVFGAGHPLPDAHGVAAARAVAKTAQEAQSDEALLVLISGGGSALLPAPVAGITLEDKVRTTQLLLSGGADIGELNTVRKHLSELKGGGLASLAAPARVLAIVLSDVIGDDLSTIASGPTVPDPTTFADALAALECRSVLEQVPTPVRNRLERGRAGAIPDTPKPGDPIFAGSFTQIIAGNRTSAERAKAAVEKLEGITNAVLACYPLCGEAREAAGRLVDAAFERRELLPKSAFALVTGGETTVTVRGRGQGGRNQELALAFALEMETRRFPGAWGFLSAGTDGRDGPTDAAGGLVDGESLARMRAAGVDPRARLEDNDAYHALASSGDLVITGPTGTNVADLQIFVAAAN